jgi:hypothetical protein
MKERREGADKGTSHETPLAAQQKEARENARIP